MSNQHGHYRDVAGECSLQFDPHEVIRILQPPLPCLVARIRPARTDDGEHGPALAHDAVQMSAKVLPQRNRIHILEHAGLAEFGHKPVIDAPRGIRVVVAAVADEDAGQTRLHHLLQLSNGVYPLGSRTVECPFWRGLFSPLTACSLADAGRSGMPIWLQLNPPRYFRVPLLNLYRSQFKRPQATVSVRLSGLP